ncbi:hypothetical protein PR048_006063 [Dryococelus australis]|uniref:Alcohol dehydrogenase-like C-terminal domain-containing protein n=1 Tax=Dryococelus australis TaxID=614101 RepID=A0ABQ9I9X2_9NEOP|nr:hypothetical protein PR048_006063 [Dryococelus australis]
MFKMREVQKPRLALNCVGGRSSQMILRQLNHGGVMVTYGGMSREPVPVHTSLLIFNNVTLRGYWMTAWTHKHAGSPQHQQMTDHISQLLIEGKLKSPVHKLVPVTAYKEAIESVLNTRGFVGFKHLFDFQNKG